MSEAAELLQEARRRGIILEADGESIRYRAPRGSLTADLHEAMRARKAELLQALTVPARVRGTDRIIPRAVSEVCWHCRGAKVCTCISCAEPGASAMSWQPGQCSACKGAGALAWGRVQ